MAWSFLKENIGKRKKLREKSGTESDLRDDIRRIQDDE